MTTYTLKQAASRLPELVAKARAGEDIAIKQQDGDLVRLVPEEAMTEADRAAIRKAEIEWLKARRVTLSEPVDFTALIRQMRDEGH